MSHARLFRRAEILVERQIRQAVESTGGDRARALRALIAWAKAGGRQRGGVLIRATRSRVGCPPTIAAVVDRAIAEVGETAAMDAVAELVDPRENPARRLAIEHEVAAAAAVAIRKWVRTECKLWRESHSP